MNYSEIIILIALPVVFIIYALIVIAIFFSPSSIKSLFYGAPPIPTPKSEIKCALKAVELSEGDSFYDLGSCTGRVVAIARRDFRADAKGIEYSLFWYLLSKINLRLRGLEAEIIRKNFLDVDLSDADVLYMYGSPMLMKRLENGMDKENSIKLVSYCFSFPDREPEEVITSPKGKNIFIYKI